MYYKSLIVGGLSILLLGISGCSQKDPGPVAMTHTPVTTFEDTPSVGGETTQTTVSGGVTQDGKYTGLDGVSKSGIKMIYFATNRYTLDPDQIVRLREDLPKIRSLAQRGRLRIEGNCDEVGTDEYNHALGLKRARSVKLFLKANGIDESKMDIISYGESNPVCTGSSPACHAKNRRVEINLAK